MPLILYAESEIRLRMQISIADNNFISASYFNTSTCFASIAKDIYFNRLNLL